MVSDEPFGQQSAAAPGQQADAAGTIAWSGQYEFMQRVRERLKIFIPLTVAIIFVLFYFTFRSVAETLMVMLGVPLSLVGGVWYLALLGYNMSIAVWVGIIALAGVAAETSAVGRSSMSRSCSQRSPWIGDNESKCRMNTIRAIILFVIGLGLILYFAEKLVKGVVGTSVNFGISPFLISVLFIGFDPENLVVGAVGSFKGIAGIALGSIIGAAMVAIALAFGITALFAPMKFAQVPNQFLPYPFWLCCSWVSWVVMVSCREQMVWFCSWDLLSLWPCFSS